MDWKEINNADSEIISPADFFDFDPAEDTFLINDCRAHHDAYFFRPIKDDDSYTMSW